MWLRSKSIEWLFLAWLVALPALGGLVQVAMAETNAPAFSLTTTRHELEGIGHYYRAVATLGTNQLAFIVPKGYFIRLDEQARQLRAVERDDKCSITVRLFSVPTNAVDTATGELKPAAFRELLLARHPEARIGEELTLTAGGAAGPAYDFVWRTQAGFQLQCRIAFIPTPAGIVEFYLLTSAADKDEFTHALNTLMLTFRFGSKGRIELPELSNKF